METNEVKLMQAGLRCPRHGLVKDAEHQAQDPAPCGCAWVWEDGKLIAVPSWKS